MFNHLGLFPAGEIYPVPASQLKETPLSKLPSPKVLANQVVQALQSASPDNTISLPNSHQAAFNNNIILQTWSKGQKHVVHINPVSHAAQVVIPPKNEELDAQQPLLPSVHNIKLDENPYQLAQTSVPAIMSAANLGTPNPARPQGWCKLNFIAEIDGEPARVTYVLRDGHVDITRFTGEDGMIPRGTFLRLHTFHGRTPDSSARNVWSFFIDLMALAMITWGITGLVMWWQMKSLRRIGGLVLLASLITAVTLYFQMEAFHALTKM